MAGSKVISQVEVLSASDVGRRRGWSDEDKIRIVEESLRGARRGAAARALALAVDALAARVPGGGAEGGGAVRVHALADRARGAAPGSRGGLPRPAGQDRIEVVLTNGRRLVIGAEIDLGMLARLVQVLERA